MQIQFACHGSTEINEINTSQYLKNKHEIEQKVYFTYFAIIQNRIVFSQFEIHLMDLEKGYFYLI